MSDITVLAPANGYFSEQVESETLLFSPARQKAICLDGVATLIWKMCDGTRTQHDVIRELVEIYPEQAHSVEQDVKSTLEKLISEGAIMHVAKKAP